MENVILTNMCMVCDNRGNVLVQERRADDRWPGIAFPGGHIEHNESFTSAVIREVFEETGIKIKHPRLCGIKQWQTVRDGKEARYIVLLYKANEFEGEVCSSSEGKAFWVKRDELKNLKLANTFEHMLKVFEDDDIEELFSYKEKGVWQFDFL